MPSAAAAEPEILPRFQWDADRYEEAIRLGVFGPDDKIQLIDGEIITMSPQLSPHSTAILLTARALEKAFTQGHFVRAQLPLRLGADSLPEPDVAVVRGGIRDYALAHPRTAALVVEVADSTLALDRRRKLALYARHSIPEYWIVNLPEACVEVHRQPAAEAYGERRVFRTGETIDLSGVQVPVADLLP
jgi:Uma2 family endonuclease